MFTCMYGHYLNKRKRVTFSDDTKLHDGASDFSIMYYNLVRGYFQNRTYNIYDISRIVNNNIWLLLQIIEETQILLEKLNIIKEEEMMDNLYDEIFGKDIQYAEEDSYWDSPEFVNKSTSKRKKGFAISRFGNRSSTTKLTSCHIPWLEKLLVLLYNTQSFIENGNWL